MIRRYDAAKIDNSSNQDPLQPQPSDSSMKTKVTFCRHPLTTTKYFALEILYVLHSNVFIFRRYKKLFILLILIAVLLFFLHHIKGPHSFIIDPFVFYLLLYIKWMGLGIVSSIGFGFGIHTFVLYLAPFISAVTIAAWECNSIDFPSPPYPHKILCPSIRDESKMTLFMIAYKISLPAFFWGFGTALGELPPYLMAKAASHSRLANSPTEKDTYVETECLGKFKRLIPILIQKSGFFAILLFASIPNPLFDLAGITCGHFMIPFWTFFWATVIGKAVIKVSIQSLFIMVCFSPTSEYYIESFFAYFPVFGVRLANLLNRSIEIQRSRLHRSGEAEYQFTFLLIMFNIVLLLMIVYFLISFINALATSHINRLRSTSIPLN